MVARPFKAGNETPTSNCVAERQLSRNHQRFEPESFRRRSATRTLLVAAFPGVETPGYHQASLREKRHLRFAAERHLMVARPFKAGIKTPPNDCVAERQLMLYGGVKPPSTIGSCSTRNAIGIHLCTGPLVAILSM